MINGILMWVKPCQNPAFCLGMVSLYHLYIYENRGMVQMSSTGMNGFRDGGISWHWHRISDIYQHPLCWKSSDHKTDFDIILGACAAPE